MNAVFYLVSGAVVSIIFFVWGAATIHNQVWPYSILRHLRSESNLAEYGLHNRQRRSLFDAFTHHQDLVFLGDSITEQAPWGEMFPGVSIANRGVGGERFEDMLTRIDDIVALQPKAVFLMGGVNNAINDDVFSAMFSFSEIVETLHNSGIDLYLQTTIEPRGPRRAFVKRLNMEIKKYAKGHGLVLIDTAPLTDEGGLRSEFTLDGIHLNGDGFRAWQEVLEPYIRVALENR